jgi:hypothetical protein
MAMRAEREEKLYASLTAIHARQVSFACDTMTGSDGSEFLKRERGGRRQVAGAHHAVSEKGIHEYLHRERAAG